jgi:hypothetical protein
MLALAGAAAALALAGAGLLRPRLERAVRARIEAVAARRGLLARVEAVRVGLWPPLRLEGVHLEKRGTWRLEADSVEAWWPGRTRLAFGRAVLHGPAGLRVEVEPTTWDVLGMGGDATRAELLQPVTGLVVGRGATPDGAVLTLTATDLPAARIGQLRRLGRPLLDPGTVSGRGRFEASAGVTRFDVAVVARSARPPALSGDAPEADPLGEPTDLDLQVAGSRGPDGAFVVPRWRAAAYGAAVSGSLAVRDADPRVDLSLEVERVELARVLRDTGLGAPRRLAVASRIGGDGDLGSASLSARARGRLSDPASFVVTQRLDFDPPRLMPAAIAKLKGDFVHEVLLPSGATLAIEVAPESPDFMPLAEVPPLFLRTLLMAEDAGFYGHPGLDLREIPSALLTDLARGGAHRGASTITQQLAKNLFLTGEKRLGRKLQEACVALLLESALGKERILEIYLNVIEWGPGLHGLRSAARTYFGREPGQLTPAQTAFLVSLIPGPLKYQTSFARGSPGAGLRKLVDALLAKLRAAQALTEEEYQQALAEEILVEGRGP